MENKLDKTIKNFPSSTRVWNNSIYSFNKNLLNLIPDFSKLTNRLIRNYFNGFNSFLNKKVRKYKILLRFRRFSSHRIYVSNGVFKHTNDNVTITIYIYNRQKTNYTYLIEKKFHNFIKKNLIRKFFIFKQKMTKNIEYWELNNIILRYHYQDEIKKYVEDHEITYKQLIKKVLKRYKKYFWYKQLLFINNSKSNYNYLSYLTHLLKKIYKKNVQFDIINLSNFYLNSDIFTQSILLKIKKNRKNLIRKLKKLVTKSNVYKVPKFLTYKPLAKNTIEYQDNINDSIINNLYKNKKVKGKLSIKRTVLSLIKFKKVSGVRIEAKGRLTRRYTAARSLSKVRYKGNLVNIDSSYLGLSSVFLRGNLRSNLQHTKLKSKTRIGSFGLKGWVSGY